LCPKPIENTRCAFISGKYKSVSGYFTHPNMGY
jgi:hypothetical protein